ncbi:MAG: hypothetical protein KDG57_23360 [Rhodoferax sp.]|nr:hypothetical protein [Rhodoferax sp.]
MTQDEVRAAVAQGELRISNYRRVAAQLIDKDERALVPMLSDARLLWLNQNGLLLTGTESVFEGSSANVRSIVYKQSWWCVPIRWEPGH